MKKYLKNAVEIESLQVEDLGLVTKGMKVKHPLFGTGSVIAIFKYPDGKNSLGIDFEDNGYTVLAPEYAKLEKAIRDIESPKSATKPKVSILSWLKNIF